MAAQIRYFADPRLTPLAVPIETLELDPDNELDHTEASVQEIVKLLVRFGWREPVGALKSRRKVKIVIRGNRTLMAARWLAEAAASEDLELRERAVGHESWWKLDEPPDWLMAPALFFADDDATRTAWRISHNKSAAAPAWDWGVLAVNMAEVSDEIDWGELGWSAEELAELFEPDEPEPAPEEPLEPEEPPIPEPPAEPVTKRGEVIQLGPHTLHCEDCMVVMAAMPDNSVDFIGTDGPYGLSPDGKARTWDDLDDLRRLRHKCQDRCPTHIVGLADVGDSDNADPEAEQERVALRVRLSHRLVKLGGIELDDGRQGWEVEVDGDRPVGHVENLLVREWDLAIREELAKGQLGLWVREGLPCCVGACSCATECSHPFVGVLVGLRHDALAEAEGSPGVVATPRAELRAVLRFHVGGCSADLFPAEGASDRDPVLTIGLAVGVGAGAAAGGLPAMPDPGGLSEVGDLADGALAFDLLTAGVLVDNSTHDPKVNIRGFMSRSWDAAVPGLTWARECLRILKPGGYLASFSSTRTYHRHACAIEDAGFDIIDQLSWLQWEGMPHGMSVSLAIDKAAGAEREVIGDRGYTSPDFSEDQFTSQGSMMTHEKAGRVEVPITAPATDLAKAWDDCHTRLKPCTEPICLAQKPIEGTVVENIKKWGTGALNIGATRHPEGDPSWPGPQDLAWSGRAVWRGAGNPASHVYGDFATDQTDQTMSAHEGGRFPGNVFQYPKPSTREKTAGTDDTHEKHTTVKPVAAMARLLRLGLPPGGGTAFEPFGGSGTTLVAAAKLEGVKVILAEREPGYMDIIRARGTWALANAKAPA